MIKNTMKKILPQTKLIKQKYEADCAVACLAMFCGVTYEQLMGCIQFNLNRQEPIKFMNNEEMAKILIQYGHKPMQSYTLLPEVKSIICVPSLGTKKKFHYIYFDGYKIHDPSNFETYSNSDFINDMPMADSIIDENDLIRENIELPSHLHNYFDWNYINDNN